MKEISLYCYVGELHPLEEACFDISFGHEVLGSELYVPKIQDLTPQIDLNIHSRQKIKPQKTRHNVSIYVCMYVFIQLSAYLFMVNLTIVSVVQTTQRRMRG